MMLRTICGTVLMILMMSGCSNDGPTAPLNTNSGVVAPAEMDQAAISLADSRSMELIRPGTPVLNSRGNDNLRGGSRTRRTFKAAHQLERAVQDFARDNDGIYPTFLDRPNIAGKTLLDYLPSGQKLRNAFTGLRTEPSGYYAESPGAIGYNVYSAGAVNVGYIIIAQGADASETLVLEFLPASTGKAR